LILLFVLSFVNGYSQHESQPHDHHAQNEHVHKNEISIAIGVVPLPAEDEVTLGLHLHYIKGIGANHRFGLGLSLETIFDEHKHYTLSFVTHYRIYKDLIFAYAPGILMLKENSKNEFQFAQHIELAYEFELGNFHLGPVAEIGFEKAGVHYMGGLHIGIDF
jgi:hypothetical protein